MNKKIRRIMFWITLSVLIVLGIWQICRGEIGFGAGLVSAALGVSAMKTIKKNKIKELQANGFNPYDERSSFIADRAAMATWKTIVALLAAFVLLGSVFGPQACINPYDLSGLWLAVVVIVYYGYHYYYNHTY